jgi:hypothetical protein
MSGINASSYYNGTNGVTAINPIQAGSVEKCEIRIKICIFIKYSVL